MQTPCDLDLQKVAQDAVTAKVEGLDAARAGWRGAKETLAEADIPARLEQLSSPNGEITEERRYDAVVLEVEGHCPGLILAAERGSGGFGYDPIFLVPETGLSFAEMDAATKGRLGHRGRAFALLEPRLRALLDQAFNNS